MKALINEENGKTFYERHIKRSEISDNLLYKQIQQGNLEARNKLVLKHVRFAIFTATKNVKRDFDIEDLIQDSLEGMLKAANKVDDNYKNNFTTYANWYIISQLSKTFEFHESSIKIPQCKNREIVSYIANKKYAESNNSDFPVNKKMEIYNLRKKKIDTEDFVKTEDFIDLSIKESNISRQNMEYEDLCNDLRKIFNSLTTVESRILIFHFGLFGTQKKTHKEIGRHFGKTASWSQQLEKKIFLKIKKHYPFLKDYLVGA